MRICIVGYGNMGQLIEREALARGHQISATVDPNADKATHKMLSAEALREAEIAIDFSLPGSALANIKLYSAQRVPAVVGTTGWYDSLATVTELVEQSGTKLVWASNFAIGVQLYFKLIAEASRLFADLPEFDVWGYEVHHSGKADSPSGTAKTLAQIITKNCPRKSKPVYEKLDRKRTTDELHFGSVRGGAANFEHTIAFDSPSDCLTIRHAARDRSCYATGAVRAAEWLSRQGAGCYTVDDLVSGLISKE